MLERRHLERRGSPAVPQFRDRERKGTAGSAGGRGLQLLLWLAVPAVGVLPAALRTVLPDSSAARPVTIGSFFLVVVLRTGVAAATGRAGRTLPMMMMLALALFGTGSMILALNPLLGFPSMAELFFGSAYMCFIGFLVLDTAGRAVWTLRALLETGVVAGGVVSAGVFLLVTPLAAKVAGGDLALLVALVYPMADVVLLTILLTQFATRRRALDRRSGLLLAGLTALAVVDASLPLGLGSGSYAFSTLEDVVWAAALVALADCAARPSKHLRTAGTGLGAPAAVLAGTCAVTVLAVDTGPGTSSLTRWPAILTMVLSLGLLMFSLREARSASEAQRLSRTDDLTGLGNRRAAVQRLATAKAGAWTLLLLDLNGFKAVNDAFGHPEGDRLLVRVGERLREAVPTSDLVARLGGDEFAVICEGCSKAQATARAESILAAMREPLVVADLGLTVTAAIGVAAGDPQHRDGSDLLRRADVAMYRAKASGAGYCWYDPGADEFSLDRLHLIEELRAGIGGGQLSAYFQPQVRATDGELVGVEALVRWQHPTRGLLAPMDFLGSARLAGLMLPLSLEMVRQCVKQATLWEAAGCPRRISLNVDPPELLSGAWGPALLAELEQARLRPELFTVELTEELLLSDSAGAAVRIQELADRGLQVSIDDYGTGYSGLAWLQKLPVHELKLARPFVSRILTDRRTSMIVKSTVQLAQQLQIRVVAEGVEDHDTAQAVTDMGVELLQGYLVCRPVHPSELQTWIQAQESRTWNAVPRPRSAGDDADILGQISPPESTYRSNHQSSAVNPASS